MKNIFVINYYYRCDCCLGNKEKRENSSENFMMYIYTLHPQNTIQYLNSFSRAIEYFVRIFVEIYKFKMNCKQFSRFFQIQMPTLFYLSKIIFPTEVDKKKDQLTKWQFHVSTTRYRLSVHLSFNDSILFFFFKYIRWT